MALSPDEFRKSLALHLARKARAILFAACKSRFLKRDLTIFVSEQEPGTARVFNRPYWALFYHDGRGVVRPHSPRSHVIWFKNPKLDPRAKPTYPIKITDRKRLTKVQFLYYNARGMLYVAKASGPASPHPFYNSLANFVLRSHKIVWTQWERYVRETLGSFMKMRIKLTFKLPSIK